MSTEKRERFISAHNCDVPARKNSNSVSSEGDFYVGRNMRIIDWNSGYEHLYVIVLSCGEVKKTYSGILFSLQYSTLAKCLTHSHRK